jgi:hypothetical protein
MNFLTHSYSAVTTLIYWPIYFSQRFPFPTPLKLFPFYSLGPMISYNHSGIFPCASQSHHFFQDEVVSLIPLTHNLEAQATVLEYDPLRTLTNT